MENKKKSRKKIIIIVSVCFILLIAGFFIFQYFSKPQSYGGKFPEEFDPSNNSDRRGGMLQIDNQTQSEIASFFDSSPSSSEVEEYCNTNPMYCMYYCKDVNPEFEYCADLEFNPGERPNE